MNRFYKLMNSFKALGLVFLLAPSWAMGQTLLGPSGGFEGSSFTVENSTIATTGATNKWQKANATQTLTLEATTIRTGSQSLKINNSATTGRRVFTPSFTPSAASGVRLVIQYYRYSSATTNTQQNQNMISFSGAAAGESTSGSYTTVATAGTWEKVTYVPTTTSSATTLWAGILNRAVGTSPFVDMFIDDFCVYEAIAVDNTAASAPTSANAYVSNTSTTSLNISWAAASGGVDGGGYILVRGISDPTTTPITNGIYAVGNSIGTGSVVYVGNSPNFTDVSLTTETPYFYRIYTFDKAYNYSAAATTSGTPTTVKAITSSNWSNSSTWNSNTAPTGTTNVTIPTGVTVNLDVAATINNLTFTGGGKLTLGANNLTVNGTATGDDMAGFIVTNGTGGLIQSHPSSNAPKLYPVGPTATNYDPVTMTTPDACSFKVRVAASINPAYTLAPSQTNVVTPRQWDIDLLSGMPTVNLQLKSSDLSNAPMGATGMIGHWNGTSWDALPCIYAPGTWSVSGVTQFSPFIVSQPLVALGVDFKKIAVTAKNNSNLVEWSTASEKNSQSFDIQHATNGLDFVTVGNIKANGTTNVESKYSFSHANPSIGTNYYRLKQVDANGTASFSKIVSVQNGGTKAPLLVYPSLATDVLHVLTNSDKNEAFQIVNTLGQIVLTGRISNGADININALTNGHYILKTAGELARFVKN